MLAHWCILISFFSAYVFGLAHTALIFPSLFGSNIQKSRDSKSKLDFYLLLKNLVTRVPDSCGVTSEAEYLLPLLTWSLHRTPWSSPLCWLYSVLLPLCPTHGNLCWVLNLSIDIFRSIRSLIQDCSSLLRRILRPAGLGTGVMISCWYSLWPQREWVAAQMPCICPLWLATSLV